MRFVFVFFCLLLSYAPLAQTITPSQNMPPKTPIGFTLQKIASNLGEVTAMAAYKNDMFTLDKNKGRVLRLRDQNGDGIFDMQTTFLIGFNAPSDIIIGADILYISDADGVWAIKIKQALIATAIPKNIARLKSMSTPRPLAISANNQTLYLGNAQHVIAINIQDNSQSLLDTCPRNIAKLAVAPNGAIWAASLENNGTHIYELKQGIQTCGAARGAILPNITIQDMLFWQSSLLIASSGPKPMIAKGVFQYGQLTINTDVLIDGFSAPSYRKGTYNIWSVPSALTARPNGHLSFSDRVKGVIWQLKKVQNPVSVPTQTLMKPEQKITENQRPEIALHEPVKEQAKGLPKGSSIISASTLKHGSKIGRDKLLSAQQNKNTKNPASKPND